MYGRAVYWQESGKAIRYISRYMGHDTVHILGFGTIYLNYGRTIILEKVLFKKYMMCIKVKQVYFK